MLFRTLLLYIILKYTQNVNFQNSYGSIDIFKGRTFTGYCLFGWHVLYLLVLEEQEKELEKERTAFEGSLKHRQKG